MADRASLPALEEIRTIARHFPLLGSVTDARPHGSGHINDTLAVTFDQAGTSVRYIFQRINHTIFKDVPLLMDNIRRISAHVSATAGRTDSRRALTLVPALDGRPFHRTSAGEFWRVYLFIEKARTYDEIQSPQQAMEVARAFGAFQKALADLPGERLMETIPGFHDTRRRFEALRLAAEKDVAGRKHEVATELDCAFRREAIVDHLLDLARAGAIPERVTHNDTKMNNVMLDDATGEGICVIDLDTAMPGLALYDFGDMVRTTVSPAAEDEQDRSRITVRMPVFEALVQGFTAEAGAILTDAEWDNLVFSGKLITFEIGMRFLTDYLEGDIYFKMRRPGQNLARCRTQFRLVECIEECADGMEQVVRSLRARNDHRTSNIES